MKQRMKIPKMKPCPFCGSKPRFHETDSTLAFIWCERCQIEFRRYAETAFKAGGKVLRLWNKRREVR